MAAIVQKALHTCSKHENQETDMYCKTCTKPVCVKCVQNDHKEHEWDSMKNVAKSLRTRTTQRKLHLESILRSVVLGVFEILDFVSSRSEKSFASNCSDLESIRKKLVDNVNKEVDEMKKKCENNHQVKTQVMETIRDTLKINESRMELLIREMETGAADFTDFDLIEMHEELLHIISEIQNLSEIPGELYDEIIYKQVSSDMSNIKSLIGSVESKQSSSNLSFVREYDCNGRVNKICPINGNEVWVHDDRSTLLHLIDRHGNTKKSIDIRCDCCDLVVDTNGTIFFTDDSGKRLGIKEEICSIVSTESFIPFAICLTRSSELIVSLTCTFTPIKSQSQRQHLLRRLTKTGDKIHDIELEIDDIASLYATPIRLMEQPNGNICILLSYFNMENDAFEFSTVHCFEWTGKIVFKYGGLDENLDINGFYQDIKGNIIFSDVRKKNEFIE